MQTQAPLSDFKEKEQVQTLKLELTERQQEVFKIKEWDAKERKIVTKALGELKEQAVPVAVTLDFSCVKFSSKKFTQLARFFKQGNYPEGMTVRLDDVDLQYDFSYSDKTLLNAFIHSQGKGLHLYISYVFFSFLQNHFYQLLIYSQCFASLHLMPPRRLNADGVADYRPRGIVKTFVRNALLANTHLLELEIHPSFYQTAEINLGYPARYIPGFIHVEDKSETDFAGILSRNQYFDKGLLDQRVHSLNAYFNEEHIVWVEALSEIIHEYAMEQGEQIVITAMAVFTSIQFIQENAFKEFCAIYLQYREACQRAFVHDLKFRQALRHCMRSFFVDLRKTYELIYEEVLNTKFFDDLFYFVQLAEITSTELECQMAFLLASEEGAYVLTSEDQLNLRKACIDYQSVQSLTLPLSDVLEQKGPAVLDLNPRTIVRVSFQSTTSNKVAIIKSFCKDLADRKCPQHLTIIIGPSLSSDCIWHFITELAKVIEEGTYPAGTCLIFNYTPGIHDYEYCRLLQSVVKNNSMIKPELHLVLPIAYSEIDLSLEKNVIRDCILHSKSLKTLILSRHSNPYYGTGHFEISAALEINHTLTTFDFHSYVERSMIYTFFGVRNRQLLLNPEANTYEILIDIFKNNLETHQSYHQKSTQLFSFAIIRYQDNLSLLLNPIFLDFFKKNVLYIMHEVWMMLDNYTRPSPPLLFDSIARTLLAAGKITQSDLDLKEGRPIVGTEVKKVQEALNQLIRLPPALPSLMMPIESNAQVFLLKELTIARNQIMSEEIDQSIKTILIRNITDNHLEPFKQTIRSHLKNRQLTLEQALRLSSLILETKSDLSIENFTASIDNYDRNKGRFRKSFNNSTQTINDFKFLQTLMRDQHQAISAFQIELCLIARDLRNSNFRFRAGIINQSVTFFKTGDFASCRKKSCKNKNDTAFSQTERLIADFSRQYRNLL